MLRDKCSERLDILYNLGNGLSSLAELQRSDDSNWYLNTSDFRREARQCFEIAGSSHGDIQLKARAKTNHANLLAQSHRWLEAYELYREALTLDPKNVIASSGAVKVLLRAIHLGIGPRSILESLAAHYVTQAQLYRGELTKYAGKRDSKILDDLPQQLDESVQWPPDLANTDEYTRFVGENHLALSLTIEGLNPDLKRWDSLSIQSITENMDVEFGVPPIFAMFNTLKADYMAARWLAFQAIHGQVRESGSYFDTLDYALYGIKESLLTLAQRSAFDILDRLAVAASEYFRLEGSPTSIYFLKRWHVMKGRELKKPLEWQPAILDEVEQGNTALVALSELAEDIATGGYLEQKKTLRNASTHRFVILHDLSISKSLKSNFIEHYEFEDFRDQTIASLRMVRAALIYLVESVSMREARQARTLGIVAPLEVPLHHWIRSEQE